MLNYPRDLSGYGANPPPADWPGGARIAVQFVLNYEEGGENCILHGDQASETFLSEIIGAPLTVVAVAMAADRNPAVIERALADGHEIASHGYRWINYHGVPEAAEREHMAKAMEILTRICGSRPLGWYTGRTSENTRRLVAEHGGFLYDADDYSDDLPFWSRLVDGPHLVVPYTLDANDMRFAAAQGFNSGDQFFAYLKDAFDTLYEEGAEMPKMMSIGLHCRLVGRPGRFASLKRFLDYVLKHDKAWVCRRVDIARHWHTRHPYQPSR